MRADPTPSDLAYYEGLIYMTAKRIVDVVEDDLEDIQQILRLKAWRAINTFDPARSRLKLERYVFGCLMNQKKDILARARHELVYIEGALAGGGARFSDGEGGERTNHVAFVHRVLGLVVDSDQVYAEVEVAPPLIPNTLTLIERRVLVCIYSGRNQPETRRELGITGKQMREAMEGLRTKLADWRQQPQAEAEYALAA